MYKYIFIGEGILPISTYNVMLGVGMIVFFLSFDRVIKKNEVSFKLSDEIKIIILFTSILSVFGAAFVEALYHRRGNEIAFSGFTFYGGLVTSFLILWIICRLRNLDFLFVANILALPLTLAHAFGRIGCFLGGCCYGQPTISSLGVTFPEGSLPFVQYGDQALYPTQLYESLLLFLLSLAIVETKLELRFIFYLLAYPIIRFAIEIFRGDNRGILLFDRLSPSQEISLVLFFWGIILLYRKRGAKEFTNHY